MKSLPTPRRVTVRFAGSAPAQTVGRARGVSDVEVDGPVLHCLVLGSFQPFLEALRGYEVLALESLPALDSRIPARRARGSKERSRHLIK